MLALNSYRDLVDLALPRVVGEDTATSPQEVVGAQIAVLTHLIRELPYHPRLPSAANLPSYPYAHREQLLRSLLTVRDPTELSPLPEDIVKLATTLARARNDRDPDPYTSVSSIPAISTNLFPSTSHDALPRSFQRIRFHRGDYTRLASSRASAAEGGLALVNPANTRMLGCFKPSHPCADNVIHAAAGPALRADCVKIMAARDWDDVETAEDVLVTRGGALRAEYVLHVAGPQLARKGAQPTPMQVEQLETVYRRCLDLAEELGTISTVAFPCISTGLFFFPGAQAAQIALCTVSRWLDAHPTSNVKNVIFVLFSQTDTDNYLAALPAVFPALPSPPISLTRQRTIPEHVKQWILESDSVIIHAGAGLSADAVNDEVGFGLDYTNPDLFAQLYPGLLDKTPLRCLYHTIGHDWEDPLVKWAFLLLHGYRVQTWSFPRPTSLYASLLRFATSRPNGYAVRSSNADGLFLSSGFDADRVWTPQGTYDTFQCLSPSCAARHPSRTARIWPSFAACARAAEVVDRNEMRIPPERADELIPRCPSCGGQDVFFNVRGGDWFIERPAEETRRHQQQVDELVSRAREKGGHVLLLELGAGFNTPSVVRWPSEELVERLGGEGGAVKLVRVNLKHPEVGFEVMWPELALGEDAGEKRDVAGLKLGAGDFVRLLEQEATWNTLL
ncbi:uncharacterized protein JCM10292_005352 [Rhodotorula paludigena]|uniref:uncharacterized protein n=1 Tax=Rhodotorula paludigena TaxID=86838 RepID=UPI003178720C